MLNKAQDAAVAIKDAIVHFLSGIGVAIRAALSRHSALTDQVRVTIPIITTESKETLDAVEALADASTKQVSDVGAEIAKLLKCINAGKWAEFQVTTPAGGKYQILARVLPESRGGDV